MSETGTTFSYGGKTVTTGFDHIKELGVNAVQILPFFDASNKEQREDQYNWGYNPQNYNVLEGQYSSNPYNAETRIKEFKEMVKAYNDAGIEIIMDVVYNHMSGITGSSFHKILPGYYFRYNDKGIAWNGSGCGNEVASERQMVRNYIVQSITFWAKEYNIRGFRFDLMGLLDITTMNTLAAELKKIDSNIVIYGEPWDAVGGSGSFPFPDKAITSNASKLVNVGMFNDNTRDKIKGDPSGSGKGWVQGAVNGSELVGGLTASIVGHGKQVNYITCHDNLTLADKLRASGVSDANLPQAAVLSSAVVLSSQGITFLHAGEELLRSKPVYKNGLWTGEYSHNSYN
jgi:pullulanase